MRSAGAAGPRAIAPVLLALAGSVIPAPAAGVTSPAVAAPAASAQAAGSPAQDTLRVPVFRGAMTHFHADSAAKYAAPGVVVADRGRIARTRIDLTDHLAAGRHTLGFAIENVRPADEKGNFGYWRVSASLVGWDHEPRLWRN